MPAECHNWLGSEWGWIVFIPFFKVSYVCLPCKPTYATTLPKQRPKASFASAAGYICYTLSEASTAWLHLSNIPTHQRDMFHPLPIWWVQTYWHQAANIRVHAGSVIMFSSRTDVIFLNMTQSPSAPFLNTLGCLGCLISEQDVKQCL